MKIPFMDRFFKQPEPSKSLSIQETAWSQESIFAGYSGKFESYNPDQLASRKGHDIYEKMLRDPQVKSAFNLLIDVMLSRSFRFEKCNEDEIQSEIETFFYYNIENIICGTWQQAMRNVLMAKAYGFSVTEKVFEPGLYEGKDKWFLKALKSKPYFSFIFEQDVYGNILSLIQEGNGTRTTLDKEKFIIFVAYPEINAIYGESDLRAAYKPYWAKQNIEKMWNIYCERMASGVFVASAGDSAINLSDAEKRNLENALKNMQSGTAIRMPQGWKLEIVHPGNTQAFEQNLAYQNKEIAKSLLVPNLMGFSESGQTGSFAQSKTQLDVFLHVINHQGNQLADTLNEQLFAELAWWNFGVKEFPKFCFEPMTLEQQREVAQAWMTAVKDGIVVNTFNDENRTRELLKYEMREEDTAEKKEPEKTEMKPEIQGEPREEAYKEKKFAEEKSWQARINFTEVEDELDELESVFNEGLGETVDKAFQDLVKKLGVVFNGIPEPKNKANLEKEIIKLKNSVSTETKQAMNEVIRENLKMAYEDGRKLGIDTIKQASQEIPGNSISANLSMKAVISPRRAVRFSNDKEYLWTVKHFVDGVRMDTAEKYFQARAFWITGVTTTEMEDAAQLVLLNGIRDEKSLPVLIDELEVVLEPLLGKLDPETGKPNGIDRNRIETIVRTNVMDAFNQASLAVYTDPELGDFVRALEFSAVMDSRTSEFCRRYNGRIFELRDPIWGSITPPAHFRCRSTVIPVTELDSYTVDKKPKDKAGEDLQPAPGFGRTVSKPSGEEVLSRPQI